MDRPVKIHVYSVCWNESLMLPYFLRHYAFAEKVVIYDHHSDDGSQRIVRSFPNTMLRTHGVPGRISEDSILQIKNQAYKESRGEADFVIIVDIDEFLYHPDLVKILATYRRQGVTLPQVNGFNMISDRFPQSPRNIYDEVKYGVPDNVEIRDYCNIYGKRCIFEPSLEINFQAGCHICNPVGEIVESPGPELKLLHFKFLGLPYLLLRHDRYSARLSREVLRRQQWTQYTWKPEKIIETFELMKERAVQVL